VKRALGARQSVPVIIVGGTNGKGSTCAMLECILLCSGYRVGLYTSPHLLAYNERVRIDGRPASDEMLCASFAEVEAARGDTPLTYFEFGTLAAWQAFAAAGVEAIILEVGLGGRLDAVNVFDADCAVVTAVDLDHMDYLGVTREKIGFEKAGIFRSGRPAIVGDAQPPQSLLEHSRGIGADLQVLDRNFGYLAEQGQWTFWSRRGRRGGLAHPALRGAIQLANASSAIAALEAMAERLPVSMQDIRRGLAEVTLPGRFQVLPGRPLQALPPNHQVFSLPNRLARLGVTPALAAQSGGRSTIEPSLLSIDVDGHLAVIYSPIGMAGGWELAQNPYALGYEDSGAIALGENILMYAVTQ